MTEQRFKVPKPRAPRDEVLADGRYVIATEHPGGRALVAYDPAVQSGAVFHVEQQVWRMWSPLPLAEFLSALQANGFALPDGPDLQVWLDAVAELAGGRAN